MAETKKTISKEEKQDAKIAVSAILAPFMGDEGVQQLQQVVQSAGQDLPGALGHAIFSALSEGRQAIQAKGVELSPRIWAATGGVLDQVVKEICQILAGVMDIQEAMDPNFGFEIREQVLDLMQDDEAGASQQQQPPMQAGPPAPGPEQGLLMGGPPQ